MAFSKGPNITNDGLKILIDMDNEKSFKGTPTTNLLSNPDTLGLYRYNNPSFAGNHVNTGNIHPVYKTPIWYHTYTPDNTKYGSVAILSAGDGFGCYHNGIRFEANKYYMASISFKEGNTPIIGQSYSYSNIGGWNHNGKSGKYYEGDGWWRFYTMFRNGSLSYSWDGSTYLATRTASRVDTIHTINTVGTHVVQSGTYNPAQFVGESYYRGTYDFNNSIYTGTGTATIVDWGIDSNMTKPTINPVYNYPNPNYSQTIWYTLNVTATGTIGTRTYSYGVFTSIYDEKYWKITFDGNYVENLRPASAYWTAPMIHEVPSNSVSLPYKFTKTSRSNLTSLYEMLSRTPIDTQFASVGTDGRISFDATNDEMSFTAFNPFTLRTIEFVFYNDYPIIGKTPAGSEKVIGGPTTYQTLVQFNNDYPMGINFGAWSSIFSYESIHFWTTGNSPYYAITMQDTIDKGYHHLCISWDGADFQMYVDGVRRTTYNSSGGKAQPFTLTALKLGNSSPNYRFGGKIEQLKVYEEGMTEAQVLKNYYGLKNRYNIKYTGYDGTTDNGGWIRFWWYDGKGWPSDETEVLGHPFGTFEYGDPYGFQRLPQHLSKANTELLAKDGAGNVYKWDFSDSSTTALRVWDSFFSGTQGSWADQGTWNPTVLAGSFHGQAQDSWQYRESEGVVSFMLDDDTCDCYSTLNAGHAMCGSSGWSQTYAQPDGAYLRYGVDILNDNSCRGPLPTNSLELFYRYKS